MDRKTAMKEIARAERKLETRMVVSSKKGLK